MIIKSQPILGKDIFVLDTWYFLLNTFYTHTETISVLFRLDICLILADKCLKRAVMASATTKLEGRLNKEISSYFKTHRFSGYAAAVKGTISYEEFLKDKMLIILAIRAGIPYSLFDLIQEYTPFSENDWASFLDISTKSLQRYRVATAYQFKSIHSEKIIEMAEVTKLGIEVFGSSDKLRLWLNTPSYALGSLKPIELLKDSYGKEMVMSELTRINYGILV